ncbi:MAG: DUF2065 domain-containing protein [Desulfovibrionaceae bacterium]|jgi:uncharacterized protein YjeT (DUF2065 family)|nr:DUF2065 domain-containing protein [Desulfovibrionaceae bacterium]
MHFDWRLFLAALGLAMVLEGIPYFLFADRMPPVLRMLSERPPRTLRFLGITAILLGLGLVLLARN